MIFFENVFIVFFKQLDNCLDLFFVTQYPFVFVWAVKVY